jgi:hypothetical protein
MGNSEGLVMEKIEALTPEQIAKLPEHIDKWVKIGLSTETPSREIQKASIVKAYQCAGRKAPSVFIWTESPLHAVFCCTFLQLDSHVWKNISKSVWESLRESVSESLSGSVRDSVSVSVRDSVSGSVRNSFSLNLCQCVRGSHEAIAASAVKSASGWHFCPPAPSQVMPSAREPGRHDCFYIL